MKSRFPEQLDLMNVCGHEREARKWVESAIQAEPEACPADGVGRVRAGATESKKIHKAVGTVYPGCLSFPSLTQSFMSPEPDVVAKHLASTRRTAPPRSTLREVLGPGPQACHRATNADAGYRSLGLCTCDPVPVKSTSVLEAIGASPDPRTACLQVFQLTPCYHLNRGCCITVLCIPSFQVELLNSTGDAVYYPVRILNLDTARIKERMWPRDW